MERKLLLSLPWRPTTRFSLFKCSAISSTLLTWKKARILSTCSISSFGKDFQGPVGGSGRRVRGQGQVPGGLWGRPALLWPQHPAGRMGIYQRPWCRRPESGVDWELLIPTGIWPERRELCALADKNKLTSHPNKSCNSHLHFFPLLFSPSVTAFVISKYICVSLSSVSVSLNGDQWRSMSVSLLGAIKGWSWRWVLGAMWNWLWPAQPLIRWYGCQNM